MMKKMKTRGAVRHSEQRAQQLNTVGQGQHQDMWVPVGLMSSIPERGFVHDAVLYCTTRRAGSLRITQALRGGREAPYLKSWVLPSKAW